MKFILMQVCFKRRQLNWALGSNYIIQDQINVPIVFWSSLLYVSNTFREKCHCQHGTKNTTAPPLPLSHIHTHTHTQTHTHILRHAVLMYWVYFLTFAFPCIVSIITTNQQDSTVLIYLLLISSACFVRCFRPSSGAYHCNYSFWYCPPMLLLVGSTQYATPANSNIGGQYRKL